MVRKTVIFLLTIILLLSFNVSGLASGSDELSGRVIIIDPGHGEGSTNIYSGYNEQTVMLALAHKIKPLLEAHGAVVYLTRPSGANVSLYERTALTNIRSLEILRESKVLNTLDIEQIVYELNEIDRLIKIMHKIISNPQEYAGVYFNTPFNSSKEIHPDLERLFELQSDPVIGERILFISLHSNATGRPINTAVNGADVFHASDQHDNMSKYYSGYSYIEQSIRFGDILLDNIHDTGIRRRAVAGANFFVLRESNIPAVLVENGHHTNARDRAKLMDDNYLDELSVAYSDAIKMYFSAIPLTPDPSGDLSELLFLTEVWNRILFGFNRFRIDPRFF